MHMREKFMLGAVLKCQAGSEEFTVTLAAHLLFQRLISGAAGDVVRGWGGPSS